METTRPEQAYAPAREPDMSSGYPPPLSPPPNATEDEPFRPDRGTARTPSPTPSEVRALAPPIRKRERARGIGAQIAQGGKPAWYTLAVVVAVILFIVFEIFHKRIVDAIEPEAHKLKNLKAGWLIPIAIFIVISFPPLFGHELLAPIVGLVYGIGVGFAIVCAGTLLGELANYFVFRFACTERAKKLELKNIRYACLARAVREGGFRVVLITRYSSLPSHLSTPVFSTCGVGLFTFTASAVLSLPKQFAFVYAGTVLGQTNPSHKTKIINGVIIVFTGIVTIFAYRYIKQRMDAVKPEVVHARRKARQTKLADSPDLSGISGESIALQPQNPAVV